MPKKGSVSMDIRKMQDLIEGLKTKARVEVGVFQSDSPRKAGELSNADLASYHEYGSPVHGLPPRSMLRQPIADHAKDIMEPFRNHAEAFLVKGTLAQLYKKIGVAAEKVVQQAFATGGFGKWPQLTYRTLLGKVKGSLKKRKGKLAQIYAGEIGQGILIRTGQLRRAFSSRVRMEF